MHQEVSTPLLANRYTFAFTSPVKRDTVPAPWQFQKVEVRHNPKWNFWGRLVKGGEIALEIAIPVEPEKRCAGVNLIYDDRTDNLSATLRYMQPDGETVAMQQDFTGCRITSICHKLQYNAVDEMVLFRVEMTYKTCTTYTADQL